MVMCGFLLPAPAQTSVGVSRFCAVERRTDERLHRSLV